MRLLLTASICTVLCMTCMAQNNDRNIKATAIGIDLGSAIRAGELKITMGHQFSKHWSLEASHGIMLSRLTKGMSDEEKSHYGELVTSDMPETVPEKDMFSGEIKLKYWVNGLYTGGFMMTGLTSGGTGDIDICIGAGYAMKISTGIRLTISYEAGIRESAIMKRLNGKGITLTLSYILT